jgi:protein-S-isoprenylcysteine O-methyltransferase Ste14
MVKRALVWVDCAFFVAVWVFSAVHARSHVSLRVWIGNALALAGFALWLTARVQLGSAFSLKARAKTLVTRGLYRRFRHPVYLFGFVAFTGVLLIWGRWIPFVCFVLFYSIELVRVRNEEQVLEETFGDEYRAYRKRTWL